jgi:hypothetical protein
MKKLLALKFGLILVATLALTVPVVLAGDNNANGDNGFQGTNKESSQLPEESMVPPPAGFIEDYLGVPQVVEGCRAGGGNVAIFNPGLGKVYGGPCCKGAFLFYENGEPVYEANQCCNPPDILYPQALYTPGNHCLCFVMRWVGPPPF